MKISKRQLKRIITEVMDDGTGPGSSDPYTVEQTAHITALDASTFIEDRPDFQRGYNDALSGRRRHGGQTPEYSNGFEEGLSDAYYDGTDHGYIGESLLVEAEMLKIMDNPYEDLSVFNRIANYALTNDIDGAMADPEVNTKELYWELDEMRPWVNRVGDDSDNWFADDTVVPDGWDADEVYEFMGDLEDEWHQDQAKKDHAAVAADPDKDWLEFMGNEFTSVIVPDDLESLGWKEYKRYIRLSPPHSISHAMGEIHITNQDIEGYGPGTREEFVEFLTKRAGKTLKKRKIYRSPPPLYD